MYRAVAEALVDGAGDDAIRVVVLTGAGGAFTAGQDLREMAALATGTAAPDAGAGFPALLDAVQSCPKPLIAAVNGVGVGLGFTLLAHVDLVLIDEEARLRVPFAELGVPPEAASSLLLPVRMGWQRASAALLASEWIDARAAVEAGIALRSCPAGTVLDEALELARRIASYPSHATREIKRLMTEPHRAAIAAARQREGRRLRRAVRRPDGEPGGRAGIRARGLKPWSRRTARTARAARTTRATVPGTGWPPPSAD